MNDTKPLVDFCTICGEELVIDLAQPCVVAGWCHPECCPVLEEAMS